VLGAMSKRCLRSTYTPKPDNDGHGRQDPRRLPREEQDQTDDSDGCTADEAGYEEVWDVVAVTC